MIPWVIKQSPVTAKIKVTLTDKLGNSFPSISTVLHYMNYISSAFGLFVSHSAAQSFIFLINNFYCGKIYII